MGSGNQLVPEGENKMLYLDSAVIEDAQAAFELHFISGITTNPGLLAKSERPASEVIRELSRISSGTVYYQLTGSTVEERRTEAEKMVSLNPIKVGLKIPCSTENLSLAAEFVRAGVQVGITAIFSPAQVYLACQTGAQMILPYVNRSTRLLGDGLGLVRDMRAVIDGTGCSAQIMAASIKTPSEAWQTIAAGAHHLTLPLDVIRQMGDHYLSDQTVEDFSRAAQQAGSREG
jgi:transaldolase